MNGRAVIEVANNPGERRYEALAHGKVVGVIDYEISGGIITLAHTIVPAEYEGQGIGSRLAEFAINDSRASSHKVVPKCPFVAAYVTRHPETSDVILEGWSK